MMLVKDFTLSNTAYSLISQYMELAYELNPYDFCGHYDVEVIEIIHSMAEDFSNGEISGHIDALTDVLEETEDNEEIHDRVSGLLEEFKEWQDDYNDLYAH